MVMLTDFPPPEDGIKHEQGSTRALLNNADLGCGTLYIAESRLSWVETTTGRGFSLEYPHIFLYAVSRDLSNFPEECLYLMLNEQILLTDSENIDGNEDDDDEGEEKCSELRFVPEDKTSLNPMYVAMSECQALHPDPNDSLSEDSDALYEEGDEDEYQENGDDNVNYSDSHVVNGDLDMEVEGQFDDAEP